MKATFYAVEHIPSGLFLGVPRRGRAYTSSYPVAVPRLFARRQYATRSMLEYVKGRQFTSYEAPWESGLREPAGIEVEPGTGRNPRDYQVVELIITTPDYSTPQPTEHPPA